MDSEVVRHCRVTCVTAKETHEEKREGSLVNRADARLGIGIAVADDHGRIIRLSRFRRPTGKSMMA